MKPNTSNTINALRNNNVKRIPRDLPKEMNKKITEIKELIQSTSSSNKEEVLDVLSNSIIDLHQFFQDIENSN